MIFHVSIAADDPFKVASVIAELWGGEARVFPPVGEGSAVALSGDERGTTIEVYAAGTELVPADGDADAMVVVNGKGPQPTATHAAIATLLSADEVHRIAQREGWIAKYRKRGGHFGVIEFWLENTTMLEVLTAEMQAEYTGLMAAGGPPWSRIDR
jgi:hypothetical protein